MASLVNTTVTSSSASSIALQVNQASGSAVSLAVKGCNDIVDNILLNLLNQSGSSVFNIRNNGALYGTAGTFSGDVTISKSVPKFTLVNTSASNKTWDILGNGSSFYITEAGAADRLLIQAGGNVTFTSNVFRVQSASSTDMLVRINSGSSEVDSRLMIGEGDTYGMTLEYDGVANIGYLGMNDNVQPTGAWSKRIQMSRGGTEVAFMAGSVGIGTDAPAALLNLFKTGANDAVSSAIYLQRAAGNYGAAILQVGNGSSGSEKLMFTAGHNSDPMAISNAKMTIQQDGNVGIGTSAPGSLFNVYVASQRQLDFYGGTSPSGNNYVSALKLGRGKASSSALEIKYDSEGTEHAYISRLYTNAVLHFDKAGTDHMTILADGKVGIGTATPAVPLHIYTNSASGQEIMLENDGAGEVGIILRTDRNSAGNLLGWIGFDGNDGGNVNTRYATIESYIVDSLNGSEDGRLTFSVMAGGSDVESMTIAGKSGTSDIGWVGVGTNAPHFPLQVLGVSQTNGDAKRVVCILDSASAAAGTGAGIALGGYTNGTASAINDFGVIQGIKENGTAGNHASAMLFSTRANGANPTERMRIDSSGNIVQAGGKYEWYDGSGAKVGEISTIGGNNLTISGTQTNHCGLSFATNSILPATQSATNNNTVDLGQNGNSFKDFYLSGKQYFDGNSSSYIDNVSHDLQIRGAGGVSLWTHTGGNWVEQVTVADGGSVGIGTDNPSERLQVKGNIIIRGETNNRLKIANDSNNNWAEIGNDGATGANTLEFFTGSSSTSALSISNGGYPAFAYASQVRLTLGSTGTPGNNDANWVRSNGANLEFNAASGDFNWEVAGAHKMRLTDTGFLGIGLGAGTDPFGQLHVNGTNGSNIHITRTSGGTTSTFGSIVFGNTDIDSSCAEITGDQDGANDSGRLEFGTQASVAGGVVTRMTIKSAGSVGIGTVTPAAKLHTHVTSGHNSIYITTDATDNPAALWFAHNYSSVADWAGIIWGTDDILRINNSGSGGDEHLTIDANGNVGIGSDSIPTKFYVHGNSNAQVARFYTTNATGGNYVQFYNGNGALGYFGWGSTGNNELYIVNNGGSNTGNINLYAGSATRLTVGSNGNVNIHDGNFTIASGHLLYLDGGVDTYIYEDTANSISIATNSTVRMTLSHNGVGINVAPDGALKVKSSGDGTNILNLVDSSGDAMFNVRQSGNDGLVRVYKDGGVQTVQIHTDGRTYFKGGSVGIGTATPGTQLDVNQTAGDNTYPLKIRGNIDNDGGFTGITFGYEGETRNYEKARIMVEGTSGNVCPNMHFLLQSQENSTSATKGDSKLTILNGGSVGIGTNAPANLLNVYGGTDISPTSAGVGQFGVQGNGYKTFLAMDSQAAYFGHNSAARELVFMTNETARLSITGSGAATFSSSLVASGGFFGSGSGLTSLNGSNISSGTVAAARLGSGSSITTKFLRGDNTWQTVSGGGGDTVSITTSADDILSVSSGAISGVDAGADKMVFWDNSVNKLTYLDDGDGLSFSGTSLVVNGRIKRIYKGSTSSGTYISGDSSDYISFYEGTGIQLSFSGNSITFTAGTSSDYRLKKNISTFNSDAWAKVKSVNLRKFDFDEDAVKVAIDSPDKEIDREPQDGYTDNIGFIAHELAEAGIQGSVIGGKDAVDEDGNFVYQKVNYISLVPVLWGALNEAISKIETLESKVQALEDK